MHIHILGICGTFMGGLAVIAKQLGLQVSGSDLNVYPPMSTQLISQGIELFEGYHESNLDPLPDLVVVGNALSRGNPIVEHILNRNTPFISGPQWLSEVLLKDRWVLAVAGTHGKTTTTSMLTWILEYAGMEPGFLVGGIPINFDVSARLGKQPFFVIEADEYDTAFFDKRSKFLHYHPRTLILNNLEYDHADIFPDLASIERQFHHVVRLVPQIGKIIRPVDDAALDRVLSQGCWSPVELLSASTAINANWQAAIIDEDGSKFKIHLENKLISEVVWQQTGKHNVMNALAAIAAARHAGVKPEVAVEALHYFQGVKRRMELRGMVSGVNVYDDFAHHPTAIATTLEGLRAKVGSAKIVAIIEPRSNTMRMGVHKQSMFNSCRAADVVYWYQPDKMNWELGDTVSDQGNKVEIFTSIEGIINRVIETASAGDNIVIMSNGGFGGIHEKLLSALKEIKTL